MAYPNLYNEADKAINVTVVLDATATRGLQAPDGSYYIVAAPAGWSGSHHRTGAWYYTVAPANNFYLYNPANGSYYVSTTPYTNKGMRVNVVSGVL